MKFCWSIFLCSVALIASGGEIPFRGFVSHDGDPVPSARVVLDLLGDSSKDRFTFSCDPEGRFEVSLPGPGLLRVFAFTDALVSPIPLNMVLDGSLSEPIELRLVPSWNFIFRNSEGKPMGGFAFKVGAQTLEVPPNGRLSIPEPKNEQLVSVAIPGYALIETWLKPDGPKTQTFVLEKGASCKGVVMDASGKPLPSVSVRVDHRVFTDDQGRYQLDNIPLGQPVSLRFWKKGYRSSMIDIIKTSEENIRDITLLKEENLQILGRVTDLNGHPIEGAQASSTRTNKMGEFLLENLHKVRPQSVTIYKPGYGLGFLRVEPSVTPEMNIVVLEKREPVTVHVLDPEGNPLDADLDLLVRTEKRYRDAYQLRTDDWGTLELHTPPDAIIVKAEGYETQLIEILDSRMTVQMNRLRRLHGRVVDAVTGDLLSGYKVESIRVSTVSDGDSWETKCLHLVKSHSAGTSTNVFTDGTFTVSGVSTAFRPWITIEKEGYASTKLSLPQDSEEVITVRLQPIEKGKLRIRFTGDVDRNGQQVRLVGRGLEFEGRKNADGTLSFDDLPREESTTFLLHSQGPHLADQSWQFDRRALDGELKELKLFRPGRISGVVDMDEWPRASNIEGKADIDGQGHFVIDRLPPGLHELRVITLERERSDSFPINLEEGEHKQVTLSKPPIDIPLTEPFSVHGKGEVVLDIFEQVNRGDLLVQISQPADIWHLTITSKATLKSYTVDGHNDQLLLEDLVSESVHLQIDSPFLSLSQPERELFIEKDTVNHISFEVEQQTALSLYPPENRFGSQDTIHLVHRDSGEHFDFKATKNWSSCDRRVLWYYYYLTVKGLQPGIWDGMAILSGRESKFSVGLTRGKIREVHLK